jgi:aminopeptidase N
VVNLSVTNPPERPRFLRAALLAAVLLLSPSVVRAQSNAERVLNGRYTPSHDFDLIHQRIEVGDFDWDSTAFDGKVTTTVVSRRPGLDAVRLDMGRRLEVRRITGRHGAALEYDRPGDTLVVRLAGPAGFGDTVRFTVDYHGRILQGHGLYFFKDEGRPRRPQQVYSGGGTDGNPNWIPTYGPPHDKATWEMVATVPARFTVVSNGRLASDRVARGTRTTRWVQERPASTYLISLVVAPLMKIRDRWRGTPVDYYVYPEDSALARPLFRVTPDMIETYSRLTGVPYPWVKYAQTTVTDFVGGMENVTATTLVDWLPDARAYLDRPWYQHVLIPHEVAHQWFGDLVTTENWAHYWLNEGMAEFMPGQYWGTKQGPHAEQDYYLDEYQQLLVLDARRRMPLAAYNSNAVYPKGALVLEMLKKELGTERFWAAMHRYLTRYAYGNATSDDLRQAVLEATGASLEWFWSQWIYQAGYPEFAVTAAYDSSSRALTLEVRQTQVDTAKADSSGLRFATPLVFRTPVAIRVTTAAGDTVVRTVIDHREQTLRIERLGGPPAMVVFDDENAVVKTLAFEQPTPWLVRQLEHPDLWNRSWAIDQLAERTGDSLAASGLGRAARQADYFLTRSQAAAALGRFPPSAALPPLLDAVRDSSAEVREAAVGALGTVGGPGAVEVVSSAWREDPSYQVRASALTALVRMGAPDAGSVVLQGLQTPSYRDVIRHAAIVAVMQAPDAGLVAAVERLAGEDELATLALATLAARGDSAATGALRRLSQDPRPWVRRWVAQAGSGEGTSEP